MHEYRYETGFVTKIPTADLIEIYKTLMQAVAENDMSIVNVAMDCIAQHIDNADETIRPAGMQMMPSVSSVVCQSCENGIIVDGPRDVCCAAGKDVSEAMRNGVCQCDDTCKQTFGCDPENLRIKLACGVFTSASSHAETNVVEALSKEN